MLCQPHELLDIKEIRWELRSSHFSRVSAKFQKVNFLQSIIPLDYSALWFSATMHIHSV